MKTSRLCAELILFTVIAISCTFLVPNYAAAATAADIQTACENDFIHSTILNILPSIIQPSVSVTSNPDRTFNCVVRPPLSPVAYTKTYNNDGTATGDFSGAGINWKGDTTHGNLSCTPGLGNYTDWFQDCFWFPLMSWLGSWFITVGGFLLWIMGGLFDILVQLVVISFGATISGGMLNAINTGWGVFRDVANIGIIGIFVFIAICTTLGIQEYGARKLVARVIVVAVLINFSLLFTKMIVDFSNFTAYQFYKATADAYNASNSNSSVTGLNSSTHFDIAGAFLRPIGITSLWNTQCLTAAAGGDLSQCSASAQSAMQGATARANGQTSGWRAFLYGLAAGALLDAVAFVFLYGCWQIATRAITIIFLMVTASVAFASYLLPKFSNGNYGWKAWWAALLNAAIFAPLLMLFLFVSTLILNQAPKLSSQNTLTAFLNDPSGVAATASSGVWTAIFTYVLVVGLLYASIKISSSFASSVGGGILSTVGNLVGMAATGGVGIASRFAIAPAARKYIGGAMYERADEKGKESKTLLSQAADLRAAGRFKEARDVARDAARSQRQAKFAASVADSRMNVMDTRPAKALTKRFGVGKAFESRKTTLSFAKAATQSGADIAKFTEAMQPNIQKLQDAAKQQVFDQNKIALTQKQDRERIAREEAERARGHEEMLRGANSKYEEKIIEEMRKAGRTTAMDDTTKVDTARDGWRQALNEAVKQVGEAQRGELEKSLKTATSSVDLKNVEQQVVAAIADPALRATVMGQLTTSKGAHESDMRREEENIRQARAQAIQVGKGDAAIAASGGADLANLKATADSVSTELPRATAELRRTRANLNSARQELRAEENRIIKEANDAAKEIADRYNSEDATKLFVGAAAEQSRSLLGRILPTTRAQTAAEQTALKEIERRRQNKQTLDIATAIRNFEGEQGTPPAGTTP